MAGIQRRRGSDSDPRGAQLSARTLQVFGLGLIVAALVFWFFTQRESALFVGAGITLSTLGWLQRKVDRIEERLPDYARPPLDEDERDEIRRAQSRE